MHIGTVLYGTYEYRTLQAPHLQNSTSTSTDQYNTMQYPYSTCTCPARQAFIHLRCCSEKVLKYAGPPVSKESAAEFMSLPTSLKVGDAATAVKIARRRPALDAHLLRVADLCQDRVELEKNMLPWGGEGSPWSSRYDAVVFRGEEVIAMPPRADVRPRCCSGKDKCPDEGKPDVMLHVEFVPRGGMAFNFDDNGVKPVLPWQVATHPAVIPCLIPEDDDRRKDQPGVMKKLLGLYGDCNPAVAFTDPLLQQDAKIMRPKDAKKIKALTADAKKARFVWEEGK